MPRPLRSKAYNCVSLQSHSLSRHTSSLFTFQCLVNMAIIVKWHTIAGYYEAREPKVSPSKHSHLIVVGSQEHPVRLFFEAERGDSFEEGLKKQLGRGVEKTRKRWRIKSHKVLLFLLFVSSQHDCWTGCWAPLILGYRLVKDIALLLPCLCTLNICGVRGGWG